MRRLWTGACSRLSIWLDVNRSPGEVTIGNDFRDRPAYTVSEAARYVKVPSATLRSWVAGRRYPTATGSGLFRRLIRPPSDQPLHLSFNNLIEAHVLRSLRTEHGVSIDAVRQSLDYAEKELGIERLLLRQDLRTDAGEIFLEKYGELLSLSRSGQLALRVTLSAYLRRVEWDATTFPIRLYPFVTGVLQEDRPIAIDPRVAFARPMVLRSGITTRAIADRIDAGEEISELAKDYDMSEAEIREAVLYEKAA